MIKLAWNKNFEKSLKGYLKKHPEKESRIKEKLKLFTKDPFSPELKNHKLSGKLKDLRAITVEYDCRVIFKFIEENTALIIDIGSHEDVY
jgi:addiction module RelE/StbE family toxin